MREVLFNSLDIPSISRFAVGFDRMFNDLHRTAGTLNSTNYPPYNIIKTAENTYVVEIAVAGFEESELDVEVKEGELIVKGEKQSKEDEETKVDYLHQGIANRNFLRTFALAENVEVQNASVKNGVLAITVEHIVPESAKPKKIAITFQK
jgi:molecular chaperone IbpA